LIVVCIPGICIVSVPQVSLKYPSNFCWVIVACLGDCQNAFSQAF
jgi:hypothetical protein